VSKRTHYALYFADDKDLHDLLSAAKQRVTIAKLLELARSRGLCLSASESRESLVAQIARLPHGWHELVALWDATDSAERREKLSSCKLAGGFSGKDIFDAAEMVKDDRLGDRGEVYDIQQLEKVVRVTVKYSDLDTSKTRLAQRNQREFTIEFEKVDGGFRVRHEAQERAHEVLAAIEDVLTKATPGTADTTRVNVELGAIRKPAQRTAFFLKLIKGLSGFTLEDVKAVRGSRLSKASDEEESEQTEGEEHVDDEREEFDAEEASFVTEVKRIALHGDGILGSPQYKQLFEHAFFVSSIVWTSTETTPDGVRAEFDASFSNPEEGTGFTYAVRKLWERGTSGELKKGKASPAKVREDKRLVRLLEEAAHAAMTEVVAESIAPPAGNGDGAP
jgi:hypothetical protein